MRKTIGLLVIVSVILTAWTACLAQTVGSSDLINKAKEYDGKTVSYSGEVIGDIMVRKDFAWINVNDGSNAIGIWARKELAREILLTGSYKTKGDTIEVVGVFHRSCPEHGGDLDIHARSMIKINSGSSIAKTPGRAKMQLSLGLFLIIGTLILYSKLK